jgi:L-iditol 2-dehydrogenase
VVERLTDGEGADSLLDTTGNRKVLEAAPELVRRGGSIAVIGLPPDDAVTYRMNTVVDKELTIHGVFRYANTYPAGIPIVGDPSSCVEAVVTHHLPLEETPHAFDMLIANKEQTIKVLIEP